MQTEPDELPPPPAAQPGPESSGERMVPIAEVLEDSYRSPEAFRKHSPANQQLSKDTYKKALKTGLLLGLVTGGIAIAVFVIVAG